jgi:hypothetical protein
MTTHYVNQDLAKHHYATLLREADLHRQVKADRPEETRKRRPFSQLTWRLRSRVRRPAVAS